MPRYWRICRGFFVHVYGCFVHMITYRDTYWMRELCIVSIENKNSVLVYCTKYMFNIVNVGWYSERYLWNVCGSMNVYMYACSVYDADATQIWIYYTVAFIFYDRMWKQRPNFESSVCITQSKWLILEKSWWHKSLIW